MDMPVEKSVSDPRDYGVVLSPPGPFFSRRFLQPRGMTIEAAALEMSMEPEKLHDFVWDRLRVDDDLAARLSRFTGTSPQFWKNMQANAG